MKIRILRVTSYMTKLVFHFCFRLPTISSLINTYKPLWSNLQFLKSSLFLCTAQWLATKRRKDEGSIFEQVFLSYKELVWKIFVLKQVNWTKNTNGSRKYGEVLRETCTQNDFFIFSFCLSSDRLWKRALNKSKYISIMREKRSYYLFKTTIRNYYSTYFNCSS